MMLPVDKVLIPPVGAPPCSDHAACTRAALAVQTILARHGVACLLLSSASKVKALRGGVYPW